MVWTFSAFLWYSCSLMPSFPADCKTDADQKKPTRIKHKKHISSLISFWPLPVINQCLWCHRRYFCFYIHIWQIIIVLFVVSSILAYNELVYHDSIWVTVVLPKILFTATKASIFLLSCRSWGNKTFSSLLKKRPQDMFCFLWCTLLLVRPRKAGN